MVNSSQVSHFTLGAYFDTGPLRWLYFLIIMSLYDLIVLSNLLLIVVICLNRTLHEPMYIFLCSLFVNELFGSVALFPFLLVQTLKDDHTVSYSFCFLQIFCIYSYGGVNFTNLAVMSYDRYVAICFPLQYNTRMNTKKVVFLVALIWLPPLLVVFIGTLLASFLTLCGNLLDSIYCDNYCILKLACSDTTVNNLYELITVLLIVTIPLIVIFYTYIRILKVCFNGSKQTRQKALSTCMPHLFSLVNFTFGGLFQIIQARFDMSNFPHILRILLSLYHLTCQPLFNTLMYGLNLTKLRNVCKSLLLKSNNKTKMIEMK